ncbi:MAG: hypothetical protein QOE75_1775 [Solirubrobacterales bacterium]|nr:hypothetical protein [Solirubrobacterales bacterium]
MEASPDQRPDYAAQATAWKALLPEAIEDAEMIELWLLLRLAEAKGQRVPIGELARSFGLPDAVSLDHDFPALSAFVATRKEIADLAMPVVPSNSQESGWYWMAPELAVLFRPALVSLLGLPR